MFHKIFYITLFSLLSSCNETLVKNQPQGGSFTPINVSSISFADVERELFQPRCQSCHGNSGGINLQSYENIKANISKVQAAIQSGRMPPGNPLSGRAKQLLELWIQKGMPREPVPVEAGQIGGGDGGNTTPPPVLPPLAPTYTSLKENVFNARCTVCHNANSPNLPPLTTRAEIINPRAELINFERPERSLLIKIIKKRTFAQNVPAIEDHGHDDDAEGMPPLKSGIEAVPAEHIRILEEWIRKGAPE